MNVLQQPDALCFSSALKDVVVESDTDVTAVFRADGDVFLTETYTPDRENRIYLRDTAKLFSDRIPKDTLHADFSVTLTPAVGAAQTIETTVFYCAAEIDVPAADFLRDRFLTLLPCEKIVYAGQKEFVSLYTTEAATVEAAARYIDGSRATKTLQLNVLNQILTVDVSPAALFPSPERISYYAVVAGNRNLTYHVKPALPPEHTQFLFLNSFGVKETFVPAAVTVRENKYENRFGMFNGQYRKYDVDAVKKYTANTGVLPRFMVDWAEDLFMSKDVFTLSDAGIEKEIVIEEATVKRSTAPDELPAFEFKYRLSKFNQHEYALSENRIFDDTHNYTFN